MLLKWTLIWVFLACALANPWTQPNYDWKQQRGSSVPGPKYLPYPSFQPIVQASYYSSIVGVLANGEILYSVQTISYEEGISYGQAQGINATTFELLWQVNIPSHYSTYQVGNPQVTTNGSLVVGIAPPTTYQQPSTHITNLVQINSEGIVETLFTVAEYQEVYAFMLGPQNEIIGYNSNQWYLLYPNAGPFDGVPMACDDSGYVYVLNGTEIYKTSLSNPHEVIWSICPGQEFCYSSVPFYVSQVSVSYNQSSLLVGICRDFADSDCYLVSLSSDLGNTEWIYVIYDGPITRFSIAGEYIYINYGEYPMALSVLNNNGYSINTYFMNTATFVGDTNGIVLMLNGTYFQPMILTSIGPQNVIAYAYVPFSSCVYEDTSLFFTAPDTIWLSCSQQLGVIHLSLQNEEEDAKNSKTTLT